MLAGLLYQHGLWIGNSRVTKYKETNSDFGSENTEIKELMKGYAKRIRYQNWYLPLPESPDAADHLLERVSEIVPDDTKWLVKTSWTLIFGEIWTEAFPEAKWLFVRRKVGDIVSSISRHPVMRRHSPNQTIPFIKALHYKQNKLTKVISPERFLFVDVDKIVLKDSEECNRLFRFCDLELNKSALNSWIKSDMWHSKTEAL